ncbi:hypothetical protein PaecuDRAFT_1814 [Paenibacillus curdlanolyticus YK9]|uniref:NAD glycohydrolase translocation F5/8 type C domain-containing protein n=1 Tax=Paenibacillus curdlanolyticus YK9 TaxID=717606 RepID=E0I863_9BACL|nr:hypothetical protein [Paenibacillus curdlanolyticus]EFM11368.1 hypothetical protein PaecuDRAFT_1814 [Paenibacillus curdlanolyticus YK9]
MKLQSIAKYMLVLVLISLSLTPTIQKTANAAGTSAKGFSSYGGAWVDQAYVEDEEAEGTLALYFDQTGTRANLELSMDRFGEYIYEFKITKRPAVTFNAKGEGTFAYEMTDLENSAGGTFKGTGTLQLKNNQIKLSLSNVPNVAKPIFKAAHTMIRDPYAYQSFSGLAAQTILSDYCQCSPSDNIKFSYVDGDNEGIEPWIIYYMIEVNNIMIGEFEVNMHKRTVKRVNDSYSGATDDQFLKLDKKVSSSSTLPATKTVNYSPDRVVDGNLTTCWCEGVKGDGIGQSMTISFSKMITVNRLNITSGYAKTPASFLDNGMVRKARITFSNETSITVDLTKGSYFNLNDYGLTDISTSSIKLTILEVRPGAKFHDTCISEISAS